MEKWEIEFEREQKAKHDLAQKIWDIPFASANLRELTKKELLMLIEGMLNKIGIDYKDEWFEDDIKDVLFDHKCWLIEALDPHFFDRDVQE